jgi:hypothetical protein
MDPLFISQTSAAQPLEPAGTEAAPYWQQSRLSVSQIAILSDNISGTASHLAIAQGTPPRFWLIALISRLFRAAPKYTQADVPKLQEQIRTNQALLETTYRTHLVLCGLWENALLEREAAMSTASTEDKRIYKDNLLLLEENLRTVQKTIPIALQGTFARDYKDFHERIGKLMIDNIALLTSHLKPVLGALKAKGEVAHAGFKTVAKLRGATLVLSRDPKTNKKIASQDIYLLPEEGVALKGGTERAAEDASLVDALFAFISPRGVLPFFELQSPNHPNLALLDTLAKRKHAIPKGMTERQLRHNIILPRRWTEFIRQRDFEATKSHPMPIELTPDIPPEHEEAYKRCEKYGWSYESPKTWRSRFGLEPPRKFVSFQKLHWEYLKGNVNLGTVQRDIVTPLLLRPEGEPPSDMELWAALQIRWKPIATTVFKETETGVIPATALHVRSFVPNMSLMHDLSPVQIEEVLRRMTPESLHHIIWTGLFQFMDLHVKNIGFVPEPNPAHRKLENTKISITNISTGETEETTLHKLLLRDLGRQLDRDNTIISYADPETNEVRRGRVDELPELQMALYTPWKLVLFDTDQCLGESNQIGRNYSRAPYESFFTITSQIPFKSGFFALEWKNQPLSEEVLQLFEQSAEKEEAMWRWIKRDDAWIYKRLPNEEARNGVKNDIATILPNYNRALTANELGTSTISSLRENFVNNLVTDSAHTEFWKRMETLTGIELTTKPIGLFNSIFRPSIALVKKQAIDENRRKVAVQLFPRLTIAQQTALEQRQTRSREYVSHFKQFATESHIAQDTALANLLDGYLKEVTNSLSDDERTTFENRLNIARHAGPLSQQALISLRNDVCLRCRPTYFNLMKVIYPLLEDAHKLIQLMEPKTPESTRGQKIGFYGYSLESYIKQARVQFKDPTSEAVYLANKLEAAIAAETQPSYLD